MITTMDKTKATEQAGEVIAGIKLYDIPEVANILSLSIGTVRNYIKDGRLKSRKIGGRHMITFEDIQKFILKPQN